MSFTNLENFGQDDFCYQKFDKWPKGRLWKVHKIKNVKDWKWSWKWLVKINIPTLCLF
jgi:hypothetical protein